MRGIKGSLLSSFPGHHLVLALLAGLSHLTFFSDNPPLRGAQKDANWTGTVPQFRTLVMRPFDYAAAQHVADFLPKVKKGPLGPTHIIPMGL